MHTLEALGTVCYWQMLGSEVRGPVTTGLNQQVFYRIDVLTVQRGGGVEWRAQKSSLMFQVADLDCIVVLF